MTSIGGVFSAVMADSLVEPLKSHARANRQSSSTVVAETASDSATSRTVIPP